MLAKTLEHGTASMRPQRSRWAWLAGGVAIVFGLASIGSGGRVLFGETETRAAAGAVVQPVLWFNFMTGFLYVAAGVGLLLWQRWGARLSLLLAAAILVMSAYLAVHIWTGGAYEIRTVMAMLLRATVWVTIAAFTCRALRCLGDQGSGTEAGLSRIGDNR